MKGATFVRVPAFVWGDNVLVSCGLEGGWKGEHEERPAAARPWCAENFLRGRMGVRSIILTLATTADCALLNPACVWVVVVVWRAFGCSWLVGF